MRHGGQRSRRFERRQRERMAQKRLVAKGREAVRAAIPEDMVKMCRNLNDDPVIVESYM